jgi:2-polyprenyl-3-methyl-5-hydroxy-6-metoxy-1,4-benzoquinol methylase
MICPICSGPNFEKWGSVHPYDILKCEACGLGITSPFPSNEDLNHSNEEIYQVDKRIETYLSRQSYFEGFYENHLREIACYKLSGKLLDIGCNIGLFLNVARDKGFDVTGVELNKACASFGKKHFGLDIQSETLDVVGFPDKSFDVITLFDVLEHVADLHGFLNEVKKILKDDGLLVLQSPNFDSLMARVTKSKWNWLTPPDHLYHFTQKSLELLLHDHGLNFRSVDTWEPSDEFAGNILSFYKANSVFGKILFKFNQITGVITLLVGMVHQTWWRKGRGGLLRVFAVKGLSCT